jgi:signal transduction histidine kinase
MPGGGTVRVTTQTAVGDTAIEAFVDDQGPGIPLADRSRVFDPFFTTKEAGAGTGLGLAVCRHLVVGFGGGLEVSDAPGGRGARFRVVIPIDERVHEP